MRVFLIIIGATLAAFLATITSDEHYSRTHWLLNEISADELSVASSRFIIVDVRNSEEYENEHIPNALSLDVNNWNDLFENLLRNWSPERPIVVYCGGQECGLSKKISLLLLRDLPQAKVYFLKGGFPAWQTFSAYHRS